MNRTKIDFYETLEITKDATHQQIKQSYKKLALKYHPDKNQDKEAAKIKFRDIAEAYAVLNDPQKRKYYDKYGTADMEFDGLHFQDFMDDFAMFEEFLDEFLGFQTLDAMFSGMNKSKGKKNKKGRAKNRNNKKVKETGLEDLLGLGKMNPMEMALFQAMMGGQGQMNLEDLDEMMMGMDPDMMEKQLQKMILESDDDDDEDQEDLTEQQLKILQFGQKNIEKKKVGSKKKKKKETRCKLCSNKIEEDEILLHFSQNHMKQFKAYNEQTSKAKSTKEATQKQTEKKQEKYQEFDY